MHKGLCREFKQYVGRNMYNCKSNGKPIQIKYRKLKGMNL